MLNETFTESLLYFAGRNDFASFLREAKTSGLLKTFIPEIDSQDRYFHDIRFHPEGAVLNDDGTVRTYGSVWQHTLAAIEDYGGTDSLINLGLLFHDIGKPAAAIHKTSPLFHNFPGHENLGVPILRGVGKRLRLETQLIERLAFLVENHMMICRFPEMRPSKIEKLITHPDWEILKSVSLHDDRSRATAFDPKNWEIYDRIVSDISVRLTQPKPFRISGSLVKEVTGLAEGPLVGKIIKEATALANQNPSFKENPKDAILLAFHALR